jgi:hypothetical protein
MVVVWPGWLVSVCSCWLGLGLGCGRQVMIRLVWLRLVVCVLDLVYGREGWVLGLGCV